MLAGRSPHVVAAWRLQAENTSCLHVVMSDPKWHQGIIPAQSAAQALARDMLPELGQIPVRYEQYELMLELLDWCPDATRERWRKAIEKNMEAFTYARRRGPEPKPAKAHGPAQVVDDIADSDPIRRDFAKIAKFGLAYGASIDTITRHMQGADLNIQNLPKEDTMTKTVTKPIQIETKHFVNGVDVTTLTDGEVWQLIANAEASIKGLKEITAQPQSLKDHIAAVEKGIADLVAFVDARNTKAA